MARKEKYKQRVTDNLVYDNGESAGAYINDVRLDYFGRPLCQHNNNTCPNVAKDGGINWGGFRKYCHDHYNKDKHRRKDYCENIDGRLGFPCEDPLGTSHDYLTGDHIDENHYNGDDDNYQTLCPTCHLHKTHGIGTLIRKGEASVEEVKEWMEVNKKIQKAKKEPIGGFLELTPKGKIV